MSENLYKQSLFFNNNWKPTIARRKLKRPFHEKELFFKSNNSIDLSKLIYFAKKAAPIWSNFTLNKKRKIIKQI